MLSDYLRVLYLHGFASGPGSRKARFFRDKLHEIGFSVEIPDLACGNFEALTVSGQLRVIEEAARNEPVILVGSSLGGYLAALYAAAHPEVDKLVLLAPAFDFVRLWSHQLGPERLEEWRKTGSLPVLHYGEGRKMPIGYQLIEDAHHHAAFPDFPQPALIFHGTEDPVVPVQYSLTFAASHRNVALTTFAAGHELTSVLSPMWQGMRSFLLDKPGDVNPSI